MISFKVCMVGCYAVGKTSLVERYVDSIYSEEYHTTIGVKIDKKVVAVDGKTANCILWDIAGEDEFYTVRSTYLRGMAGYFLVIDGTRAVTVDVAERIHARIVAAFGHVPFLLVLNKADLVSDWVVEDEDLKYFIDLECPIVRTSARSGDGVEDAFTDLVGTMLKFTQAVGNG